MKSLFVVVGAILASVVSGSTCPNGVRPRKEFRDMSTQEWSDYKSALGTLISSGKYNGYASTHMQYSRDAHNNPQFLPWHRVFLRNFERDLQAINPRVMIPYWDWTYDSQDPMSSSIFDDQYLGTQVGPSGDCRYRLTVPRNHCLVRDYDPDDFGTFYSARAIDRLVTGGSTYDTFRSGIEGSPHGTVHVLIGGATGDMSMMQSPNDPIFWMHHGFIDKLWADRQKNSKFAKLYDGSRNGGKVSANDSMSPFGVKVNTVFNTRDLCYYYQPYSKRMTTSGLEILPPNEASGQIRVPKPLPDHWIAMNGFDTAEIRATEQALNDGINEPVKEPTPDKTPDSSAERLMPSVAAVAVIAVGAAQLLF